MATPRESCGVIIVSAAIDKFKLEDKSKISAEIVLVPSIGMIFVFFTSTIGAGAGTSMILVSITGAGAGKTIYQDRSGNLYEKDSFGNLIKLKKY